MTDLDALERRLLVMSQDARTTAIERDVLLAADAIADLHAKLAATEDDRDSWRQQADDRAADAAKFGLRVEAAEARASALQNYARHMDGCPRHTDPIEHSSERYQRQLAATCECGFDDLADAADDEAAKHDIANMYASLQGEMSARIEAEARASAAEMDAARYRRLRDNDDVPLLRGASDLLSGDALDAAIAAAIDAAGK